MKVIWETSMLPMALLSINTVARAMRVCRLLPLDQFASRKCSSPKKPVWLHLHLFTIFFFRIICITLILMTALASYYDHHVTKQENSDDFGKFCSCAYVDFDILI